MAAILVAAMAGTGIAIVLLNIGAGHPPAASAGPQVQPLPGHAKMQLQPVQIPLTSQLAGQLAKLLGKSWTTSSHTITGYEFRNAMNNSAPVCLGAATTGPDAGQNYDPVLAVNCSTRAHNEIWIPVQWEQDRQNITWLVNDQYPSRCLNVNKNLGDGSPAQLWDCYTRSYGPDGLAINEAWDFGDWYVNMTSATNPSPLFLGSSDFCLNAGGQGAGPARGNELQDGTEVDIQNYAHPAADQYWY